MDRRRGLRAMALSLACSIAVPAEEPYDEHHRRADAALESLLVKYWRQSQNYLRAEYPGSGVTGYWTFAQAFDAVLDGVERTGGARFVHFIGLFHDAQEARGWFPGWYDDECWMAIALLRAYDLTGEARYLGTAEALYGDIHSGWDDTCCGDEPGGIWWDHARSQKATAANAGAVIAGARLARRTGNPSYLEFAKQVHAYWLRTMVDPVTFQVTDHIDPDGTKVPWKFTYNEGLMIGASVELFRATEDETYLETARNLASFVLRSEVVPSPLDPAGLVLSDGSGLSCAGDCHAFKGPAYRYLAELHEETADPIYRDVLAGSAEAIWMLARSDDTLFGVDWTGPPPAVASLPQMSAAVMALNIFARMSGPYGGPWSRPGRYEAEDARFRGIGLEGKYWGFSGWGYLAGWQGEGQDVEFSVDIPGEGSYEVVLGYATGAGPASRLVEIDGVVVQENYYFPDSWGWESYATTSFPWEFPEGESTITVAFRSVSGSFNYLNLDHLDVIPSGPLFVRGDASPSGAVDVSDAIAILGFLYLGDPVELDCMKSGDADDGGSIDMTDAVYILRFLFLDGAPIPPPAVACGMDPTDDFLSCDAFPGCPRG